MDMHALDLLEYKYSLQTEKTIFFKKTISLTSLNSLVLSLFFLSQISQEHQEQHSKSPDSDEDSGGGAAAVTAAPLPESKKNNFF
jgi:hypothetical protein